MCKLLRHFTMGWKLCKQISVCTSPRVEFGFAAHGSGRARLSSWQHSQNVYRKNKQDVDDIHIASMFSHVSCRWQPFSEPFRDVCSNSLRKLRILCTACWSCFPPKCFDFILFKSLYQDVLNASTKESSVLLCMYTVIFPVFAQNLSESQFKKKNCDNNNLW